jgi:hypothetical protein
MRWFPFVATFWCAGALVLAFLTLLSGIGGSIENAAIITFNTTSLGLSDYLETNSTLNLNVTALVPPTVTDPASVSQYLGIKDWYSIHYLSTCSGYWERNADGLVNSKRVNITCVPQSSGYSYKISDVLRQGLHPSVLGIADEVTQATEYTAPWIALLYVGLILAILEMFVVLPLAWSGKMRVNQYNAHLAFFSYLCLNISSSIATNHSKVAYNTTTGPPALYAAEFFALTWAAMALMVIVCILGHIEWRFELWTLNGEPITLYRKPLNKSWSLWGSYFDRKPIVMESYKDEEYEMH